MRLPQERLPTHALATGTTGLVAAVCLAMAAQAELPLSVWYPIKTAGLFSLVMLHALAHLGRQHPFAQFGSANQLTTARAVLVVLVAGLIGESGLPSVAATAAAVGLVATMLDGLDGWLARQLGMASAFGARFDVEVDALLIQVLAILAWRYGKAGPWVLLSGLVRYGFVAAGLVVAMDETAAHADHPRASHLHRANRRARPRDRGRHAAAQYGDRGAWAGCPL